MLCKRSINGLYVITDDKLTPLDSIEQKVEEAIKGGAKVVQLRAKELSADKVEETAIKLQKLCDKYNAVFVLNDKIDLAVKLQCDGVHIGKSDYLRFEELRANFKGLIGVSCYGNIELAKTFEKLGADYVAFGSFFSSPTKPESKIIPLEILKGAKKELNIPVCAIGGINSSNIDQVLAQGVDSVAMISDIWRSEDIQSKCKSLKEKIK